MGQFVLAPGAEPHHQGAEGARHEAEERRHQQRVGPVPARPGISIYIILSVFIRVARRSRVIFPAAQLVN